ncbi:hypothetical protein B0H17DRAFT_1140199 [Mycena rosella]|uniref:Uncharacterized protein n=1 Tax=Mycena rosella TaxID=1033263 RepID=A0AAD7D2Y1_MYCRO|nr:hypothetical protein B0H17DRAFT_1140199 [Mycena rosella]
MHGVSQLTSRTIGYFVDLDTKFHRVGPDVRALATTVLAGAHVAPRCPAAAHAKVLIATMAAASPEPDVDWLHAVIARADAFASEGEWAERDDLDTHIADLQAGTAGLERLVDCESERWLCALFCSLIEYSDSTQRVTPAGDTGRPCVDVPDSPPILCRFSATKPEAHPAK